MAITISGENNNDRILASDGVIDEISGINIVGLLTAGHINVGNNIQLGNAGIITATTFIGNVTGNVNSTSPLLLQTDGGERFRITGNNELGIAGGNYGSAGQVLTSGGSGNAVTWSTIPTQVTISGNADNRVITGGSGTNLNGEQRLTYNGSSFTNANVTSNEDSAINVYKSTGDNADKAILRVGYDETNSFKVWRPRADAHIYMETSQSSSDIIINTNNGSAIGERLRIDSTGHLSIKGTDHHVRWYRDAGDRYGALFYNGSNFTLQNPANDNFQIQTSDGTLLYKFMNSGKMGIGIAQPDSMLHIHTATAGTVTADADADELVLESGGTGAKTGMSILSPGDGESSIYFGNPGTNGQKDGWIKYYHETHATVANRRALTFRTSGGERLRIDSSGRLIVGGGTDPAESTIVAKGNSTSATSYSVLDMRRGQAATSDGDVLGYIRFSDTNIPSSNNNYGLIFGACDGASNGAGDNPGRLVFSTTPDGGSGPVERLRITSEGYLFLRDNGGTYTNTTQSYSSEGAFLTHYTARTTVGGDRYRRMFDIASVGANPHGSSIRFLTSADSTNPATTIERVRIDHNGRVGINKSQPQTMLSIKAERSAVPRFGIDGHYSDSSYTQSTWDDSNGLYTLLGVNHKLDANGNDATPVSSLHSSSILLDGRSGSTYFYVKPDSGTTFTEAMKINKHGIVTTPKQPAFRSYTVSDGNGNGTVANIYTSGAADSGIYDLNDDFSESTGRFTAPVDGVYQVSVAWDENSSNTIIDLQINGSGAHYSTEARSSGSGWNSWFTSSTVYLDAGDYISINLRNTSGSYPFHQAGGRWGHFSAHLVA